MMRSAGGPAAPEIVITARLAHAHQCALSAYRIHLKSEIFPFPTGGDAKERLTAQRSLLQCDSIELLIYPWRFSSLVSAAHLEAAGLTPVSADDPVITRRALGRMLWKQHGDDDPEPFERRASRCVDGWLIYGLVTEIAHRKNFKELRGTTLLDKLMRAYFVTLAQEASSELVRPVHV